MIASLTSGIQHLWRLDRATLCVGGLLAMLGSAQGEPTKEQKEFFENKIAPILSENCFKCHSTAEKVKGGLVLDSREGLLKGGDDGKVIVPGHPAESDLIRRVTSKDPDEKMPPKDGALTAQQVADLTAWVRMGAPDPRTNSVIAAQPAVNAKAHWAWQPIRQLAAPLVKNTSWCKTPVDNFIEAKLEQYKMAPSEQADRTTLIRRAYFDLTGLPPMPWEVQAFVDDKSPNAWEKVVDRLLASPRYGERWGRYWLDIARYSDTKGDPGKKDSPVYVDAWSYRDYVIDSFNQDKPYDRFILEQLAADKLGLGQDKRALAGLGFLTVGDRFNGNRNDMINDQIDVVTKGFLGLTVTCARCHDHKFDPIPQKDYYSLHGIFNSTTQPKEDPIIANEGDAKEHERYVKDREAALNSAKQFAADEVERLRQQFRLNAGAYLRAALAPPTDRAKYLQDIGGQPRVKQEVTQVLARGGNFMRRSPVFGPFARFAELPAENFAAKAKGLVAEMASGSQGRFPTNPIVLAAFTLKAPPESMDEVAKRYTEIFTNLDKNAGASGLQAAKPGEEKLDDVRKRLEAKAAADRQMDASMSESKSGDAGMPASSAAARAQETFRKARANPGKPALISVSTASMAGAPANDPNLEELRLAPFRFDPVKDLDEKDIVQRLPQQIAQQFQQRMAAVAKVELTHAGAPMRAMAVEDIPRPQDSPVFIRGEATSRGEIAPRRFLEILSGPNRPTYRNGSGRLELAEAIASKSNPLTARVMVNRIWEHHFGEGFVTTPDDFGTQSGAPSHPELLDYLATRFMQSGWSVKAMHKLIMMSAVYQEKGETNATYANLDPNNRLLWRYNLRRLEFEPLRDTLLYISGKLDLTVGGHPVNILSEPYATRRSVYGFIDRANLPEMMNHFDFANPGMPLGKRHETTVPQQALFMMNSPLMVEASRALLERPEMQQAKTDSQRVHALYWMLYQRPAKPEEIELGLGYIQAVEKEKSSEAPPPPVSSASPDLPLNRMSREQIVEMRKTKIEQMRKGGGFQLQNDGEKVDRRPMTAWEKYTQALLMANEAIYYN